MNFNNMLFKYLSSHIFYFVRELITVSTPLIRDLEADSSLFYLIYPADDKPAPGGLDNLDLHTNIK